MRFTFTHFSLLLLHFTRYFPSSHLIFYSRGALQSVICIFAQRMWLVPRRISNIAAFDCDDERWLSRWCMDFHTDKICGWHASGGLPPQRTLLRWVDEKLLALAPSSADSTFHIKWHTVRRDARVAYGPIPWRCAQDFRFSDRKQKHPTEWARMHAIAAVLCLFSFYFPFQSYCCYGVRIYLLESHLPALNFYFKCE